MGTLALGLGRWLLAGGWKIALPWCVALGLGVYAGVERINYLECKSDAAAGLAKRQKAAADFTAADKAFAEKLVADYAAKSPSYRGNTMTHDSSSPARRRPWLAMLLPPLALLMTACVSSTPDPVVVTRTGTPELALPCPRKPARPATFRDEEERYSWALAWGYSGDQCRALSDRQGAYIAGPK
jgi:hypothetical protein